MNAVIKLLKELKAAVEKDTEGRHTEYMRFACWCEKTSKARAEDIERQEETSMKLKNHIEVETQNAIRMDNYCNDHQARKEKTEKQQEETRTQRAKERKENEENMAATAAAIKSAEDAINVLQAYAENNELLQKGTGLIAIKKVHGIAQKTQVLTQDQLDVLSAFAGQPTAFLQNGYSPQSASVLGILKGMWNDFATRLEDTTRTEHKQQSFFELLDQNYSVQIKWLSDQIEFKRGKEAEHNANAAESTEEWVANDEARKQNVKFYNEMDANCRDKNSQYRAEKSIRAGELKAVSDALDVLDNEDARLKFDKSQDNSDTVERTGSAYEDFLQVVSVKSVISKLPKDAQRRISLLTTRTGEKSVTQVIDQIIADMKTEAKDDREQRDSCINKRSEKNQEVDFEEDQQKKLDFKKAILEEEISEKEAEQKDAEKNKKDTEDALEKATTIRNDDNSAFKERRKNDEAANEEVQKALEILEGFYKQFDKKMAPGNTTLIQKPEFEVSENQAPEFETKSYKGRKGKSSGVIDLIKQIIQNTVADMQTDQDNENSDQAAFEKFEEASNKAIEAFKKQIADCIQAIKDRKFTITENRADFDTSVGKEDAAHGVMSDIKESCDWIMETFEKRAELRAAEIKALGDAKATLAKFQATSQDADIGAAERAIGL